jgi:ectoine hydroxylase-related dioxygenase (phytanoyl-CoA dioxygenase family)
MATETHLPLEVPAADVEAYRRDGAACVRGVLDPALLAELRGVAERLLIGGEDFGLLPRYPGRYLTRRVEPMRRLVFESPLGAVAAQVLESESIRFFYDEIFAKAPRSSEETLWHTDRAGWPARGRKIPSIWIPLTPIVPENCLECIAGSHFEDVLYWNFTPNARQMQRPQGRPSYPDCEPLRGDPNVRFLRWSMEPGDVLFVHPWTLHYSAGNPTDGWRIALSIRVFGDDVTWDPRPECINVASVSFDEMVEGEPPDGPLFPLLWSRDGRRNSSADYPREFATRWRRPASGPVNAYAQFKQDLENQRRGERDAAVR